MSAKHNVIVIGLSIICQQEASNQSKAMQLTYNILCTILSDAVTET